MRVLIVSLSTYSASYNDGKLAQLGRRLGKLTAVAGDVTTLWGRGNGTRSGSGYEVVVLPLQFARTNATARLVGLDELVDVLRPTIVHIECEPWQAIAVQSVRLARRLRVPVGVHFAECGPRLVGATGAVRRARGSWVLKRCDYAVGWASGSTRAAERLAPGIRTETFPATGVSMTPDAAGSTDRWFGAGSATLPKLAFVGRFAEEKGIDDFIDLCDELAHHLPMRAAVAGGEGRHEKVARWADARPWAYLHGIIPRTEVSSLLSTADALVCPSRTTSTAEEQFGKAAVEAMAVGTPVFAYDCGALAEVIGAGGVVVAEGAKDQLGKALGAYFTGSAADRAVLIHEARRQAVQFTDDALAVRLISLWSSCIAASG